MTPSGIELATIRLVAKCLNHMRHREPLHKRLTNTKAFLPFIGMTSVFLAQKVWLIERRRVHGAGGDITFSEKKVRSQLNRFAFFRTPCTVPRQAPPSSSSHTHELLPHFLGQGHDDLHNTYSHSHTRWSTGLTASQDLVFISLDETNHRLFYTIIISDRSSAHSSPSVGTSRFPDMRKT